MASFKADGKMIFMIFVGLIITAVFIASIADSVSDQTSLTTLTNGTFTSAAVNSSVTLPGRANTTTITIVNASNASQDFSANFTVDTSDAQGVLGVFLVTRDVTGVGFPAVSINVSYTYEPSGFLQNSGARNIAALIVIMSALAMVVFVVVMIFKFGSIRELTATFNRRRSR